MISFFGYHNVLRKTVHYWKTLFYHMIDIAAVNTSIVYKIISAVSGLQSVTENEFRDHLVLQIISKENEGRKTTWMT